VDDNLVDKEKIGGSNYFWSFPAKKDRQMQLQHEKTLLEIEKLKEKISEASVRLADAKRGREDNGNDRATKLARLASLSKEQGTLQAELESLKENDPQIIMELQKELQLVTNAANRWTDNVFNCKSYLVKKRGMDKKEAMKILGITSAFDCK
jgi:chromosome segregation ATPase